MRADAVAGMADRAGAKPAARFHGENAERRLVELPLETLFAALRERDRERHACAAAYAEIERRPSARMPRTIERDRQVGLEVRGPGLREAPEVSGPCLLLAVEHHAKAPRRSPAGGLERFDRVEHRDNRALVIGCGPTVHAPLRFKRCTGRIGGDRTGRSIHARSERLAPRPFIGVDGLPIVVDIQRQHASWRRSVESCEDDG